MTESFHHFADLFAQLGLPNSDADMAAFIAKHRPLPNGMALADAPFWKPDQAQFLREQIEEDADWAEKVDALNAALHEG